MALEPDDDLAAGVGDDRSGVQDPVSKGFGFGDSEGSVEAEGLAPREEVLGDQDELQPGFVADEVFTGQVAQTGVFGGADAVLDVGAVAVSQLEGGDVGGGLVGDEHLVTESFGGVEQGELGTGVGSLPTGDHPHRFAPGVVDEIGELDQPGPVAAGAVGFDGSNPVLFLGQTQRLSHLEVAHLSMLHALGLGGEMRMSDLASRVVVGAATVTRRAKQLEQRGLVRRKRSDESQREVLIRLTTKGGALFERSFAHLHAEHRSYFDDRFTKEEQKELQRLLERL